MPRLFFVDVCLLRVCCACLTIYSIGFSQDIKRWEKANRNTLNAYNKADVLRMDTIVQKNQRRLQLRFFVRIGLIRFANRVLSKDKEYRERWRNVYTLGYKPSDSDKSLLFRKKNIKMSAVTINAINRRQSLTNANRRLSVVNLNSHNRNDEAESSGHTLTAPSLSGDSVFSHSVQAAAHSNKTFLRSQTAEQSAKRNSVTFSSTSSSVTNSNVMSPQRNGSILVTSKSMCDVRHF